MIDSIEGDIFRSEDREISSTKIGEIVMEHLKDLDAVAYVCLRLYTESLKMSVPLWMS